MRFIIPCFVAIVLFSCNASDEAKVKSASSEQQTIDSLNNIIKQKEEKEKEQNEAKERAKKLQALINERNDVLNKVTTDKSFDPVPLGGFRNIQVYLFNDYNYKLDQVVLKVHYIKANGIEIKSESVIAGSIPAKSRQILNAPDYTAAGTYLRVSIESVLCKEMDLCFYNTVDSISSNDPFKCR